MTSGKASSAVAEPPPHRKCARNTACAPLCPIMINPVFVRFCEVDPRCTRGLRTLRVTGGPRQIRFKYAVSQRRNYYASEGRSRSFRTAAPAKRVKPRAIQEVFLHVFSPSGVSCRHARFFRCVVAISPRRYTIARALRSSGATFRSGSTSLPHFIPHLAPVLHLPGDFFDFFFIWLSSCG